MKIHEFQAKRILSRFGIPVPRGDVAASPAEARDIAGRVAPRVVLKAQIHAGGRGRAGGIKAAADPGEAERLARSMLGATLVTPQTGPAGKVIRKLLVEESIESAKELYLGIVVDRGREAVVAMGSTEGGMEIEQVAEKTPERIDREYVHPAAGLAVFQARKLALRLGLKGDLLKSAVAAILSMFRAFQETDAALIEINPLAVTKAGRLLALDAKMNFDDNALPRHADIAALRDFDEEMPLEVEAEKANLNYVKLEGDIGCMVNGAGLAMATMDIIKSSGGRPANFLDVGGGVTEEGAAAAFKILVADPEVRGALINIFGGIVRCDLIANGVVRAARETGSRIPVVVRLEGTNVELGRKILTGSGLSFHPAEDMKDAAEKIVALVREKETRS